MVDNITEVSLYFVKNLSIYSKMSRPDSMQGRMIDLSRYLMDFGKKTFDDVQLYFETLRFTNYIFILLL